MRSLQLVPVLVLVACGGSVAEDMERALRIGNDAIALSLLTSEPAAWIDAVDTVITTGGTGAGGTGATAPLGARHGSPGNCPRIARDPDDGTSWTVHGDYRTGCVTNSGLVPAVLSGTLLIAADNDIVSADFNNLQLSLARDIEGAWAAPGAVKESYDITGKIALPETDLLKAMNASVDLSIALDLQNVVLDGTIEVDGVAVELNKLKLKLNDIAGECPRPTSGTAMVSGSPDATISYADPGDGKVTVKRGARVSEPARLCSFASDAF